MQFSEQWLRSFANPPYSSEELASRLTMAGLEVESAAPVAPPFSGVVVGEVTRVVPHPNADKLTICDVEVGAGEILSIVCGAPNVAQGVKAPCALVGAVLPGGAEIGATTLRGVQSQGMLCSARELGLTEDHSGLLLLDVDAPLGADLREYLALDDHTLTIKLTPDRADCLSVVGVAREVAALAEAPLALPSIRSVTPAIADRLPVTIEAAELCGRFSGRVIRGVNARAETPGWMKQRLERSGQRPISALVDISNYVMLELGRPTHVFDLDKVQGGLTVRWGRAGERVQLLNEQTVEVDSNVGVIADAAGVEALAGIMGGARSAVSLDTRNVYVEAAFWWPDAIRGRSRRYNFSTDAAHRFERGVDFATNVEHIEYLTRLIVDICGGQPGPVDDQTLALPQRNPIHMRVERCRRVLGMAIDAGAVARAFGRIGFNFRQDGETFVVTPPSFRFDLEIEEDLIGEVARLIGYESIPAHPPRTQATMRAELEERRSPHDIRRALSLAGYTELINYSFVDPQSERDFAGNENPIAVLNPIAAHMSVMRSTLLGGLVSALSYNLNRKAERVRVFEIGRVYRRAPEQADGPLQVAGVNQPNRLAALAYGPTDDEQWAVPARDSDFFDIKGDIESLLPAASFIAKPHPALHPGRSASIEIEGRQVGIIGQLHPRLQQEYQLPKAAVVCEIDLEPLLARVLPRYRDLPRFQPVRRDISVTVADSVVAGAMVDAVTALSTSERRLSALREFQVFDVYRLPPNSSKVAEASANVLLINEKSLAFRLVLQDTERPVTDADADAAVEVILEVLKQRFAARLRQ
ncbi:MAG TPA: phenylalanine--tRNA ligase subunit beta [Burkholderiaceae bacterium]|nr:phenylalanine--tRNA ligase subunit beta [Burkholderiaceae bacterium]